MHPTREVALRDGRRVLLRAAGPSDARELLEHVNSVGAEMVYLHTERIDKSVEEEQEWIKGFDGLASLLLVAEHDGKVVGSADIRRGAQTKSAHVAQLGIALGRDFRGQGLGRAILEDLVAWARNVGVRKVTLIVFATNLRAIALYRSLGFVEEGRLRGHVILRGIPDDEVLMSRWI